VKTAPALLRRKARPRDWEFTSVDVAIAVNSPGHIAEAAECVGTRRCTGLVIETRVDAKPQKTMALAVLDARRVRSSPSRYRSSLAFWSFRKRFEVPVNVFYCRLKKFLLVEKNLLQLGSILVAQLVEFDVFQGVGEHGPSFGFNGHPGPL
jgi:hypothetical protein